MKLNPIRPTDALNKAFRKVKPNRADMEAFKAHLVTLLDRISDTESEEFHKNLVADFLKDTYYKDKHFINTKGRNDQVIHLDNTPKSPVAVIIEAKKPGNRAEMLTVEKLNNKAFQELVLYYLRERITQKNTSLKYLVATNIYEWFIFDAQLFERLFAENKALVRQFTDFEEKRAGGDRTEFFYKSIAAPFIDSIAQEVTFAHFDIRNYEKPLRNADKADDNKLIALFKLLSPEHLLKQPFVNDSNSLDKRFYAELLHIIGLEETKDGGKKLIGRKADGQRNEGSLLENAITDMDMMDKLDRLNNPSQFGTTRQERLFSVGLQLSITWVNRILFLKLLEAQLVSYHKGDKTYRFLNSERIRGYDELYRLFFFVLAKRREDRMASVSHFDMVPYLNSSLFEASDLEKDVLGINMLNPDLELPIHSGTVLKDTRGKKRTGQMPTLEYLLAFLDAYDFSSEGAEEIQEDNKTLINASVLGLIFEKINGYKDGSFFTPGFITMYMCRETLRRAVVQKFNEAKGWQCATLVDVHNKVTDLKEANAVVNSLRVCDPAVGSGHFLVSALNELIAIKQELGILTDAQGKTLRGYDVEVVNDELTVTDSDGQFFEYSPNNKESQRVQETLFHEKQTLIENCLFGVDINPNSVKICRLRLWIELLKNAYYGANGELETLPNIDINIKVGNSLISRFALGDDLKSAFKDTGHTMKEYRDAVSRYKAVNDKQEKADVLRIIEKIKTGFRSTIDERYRKSVLKAGSDVVHLEQTHQNLHAFGEKISKAEKDKLKDAKIIYAKRQAEQYDILNSVIYRNAFEWRFEFPEVLNDNGDFLGFDVIIGNPPYIRQEEFSDIKGHLANRFSTYAGMADLFVYFVELSMNLLRKQGDFVFIIPNKWMRAGYGKALRDFVKGQRMVQILDFGDLPVFEEAITYPCILQLQKAEPMPSFVAVNIDTLDYAEGMPAYLEEHRMEVLATELPEQGWTLTDSRTQKLLAKLRDTGIPLDKYVKGKIYRGVLTGLNEAFVIDAETRDRLIAEDPRSAEIIKPFLAGRDIKRYQVPKTEKYLLFTRRGIEIDHYPSVKKHLEQFRTQLEPKPKDYVGDKWPGRKPGSYKWYEIQDSVDYHKEFENIKILWPGISSDVTAFALDCHGLYGNDNNQLIVSDDLALLGLLNSSISRFYLSSICDFVQGGFARLKIIYVAGFPVAEIDEHTRKVLENKVSQIIALNDADSQADTTALEAEIDGLVYELYGLTEEEVRVVEGVQ
jgi:adenine-specific DNA-methyltransferase